jgi:hypothetical protein
MFDQINNLHEVAIQLKHAVSLMGFLDDYFGVDEPDEAALQNRYKMYSDMFKVIDDIIRTQAEAVAKVTDRLFDIAKAMKGGASTN